MASGMPARGHSGSGPPYSLEDARASNLIDYKGRVHCHAVAELIQKNYHFKNRVEKGELLMYGDGIYETGGEAGARYLIECLLGEYATNHVKNEIVGHIRDFNPVDENAFDDGSWLLCLKNGVIDIRTKRHEPHDPLEHLFTRRLPVDYDPCMTCPETDRFYSELVGEEHVEELFELVGYTLVPGYPLKKAFLLVGEKNSGKTTFLRQLEEFLGRENVSNVPIQQLAEDRFAAAQLYGKRANIVSDLSKRDVTDDWVFKALTGQDSITAQEKFCRPFTFRNSAKIIFACNQVPEVLNTELAFFERWRIIHFLNRFEGDRCDRDKLKKITTPQELSGLLNQALEAVARLEEEGRFTNAAPAEEVLERWTRLSDTVSYFADELCEEDDGRTEGGLFAPPSMTHCGTMYKRYGSYCRERRLPPLPEGDFRRRMLQIRPNVRQARAPYADSSCARVYVGIRLKNGEGLASGACQRSSH